MTAALTPIELTRAEQWGMEENERCTAGLMCAALRVDNQAALVSWWEDECGTLAYRFDGHDGVYCEDCTLAIVKADREALPHRKPSFSPELEAVLHRIGLTAPEVHS